MAQALACGPHRLKPVPLEDRFGQELDLKNGEGCPMTLPGLEQIEQAARVVTSAMRPTPQICWATLSARSGVELWVKRRTIRPSVRLRSAAAWFTSTICLAEARRPWALSRLRVATTGGASRSRRDSTTCARRSWSRMATASSQNAAIQALGAELIEHGRDFQDALEYASDVARERNLTMVPSFDEPLVRGVATYGLDFLRAVNGMDAVYVPIGLGSGICGTIAAREALGLTTRIVGVVSDAAPAYALSFAAGKPVSTDSAKTEADGLAVRVPDADAVEIINRFAERVVSVSDRGDRRGDAPLLY